jgi:hypothetical protein
MDGKESLARALVEPPIVVPGVAALPAVGAVSAEVLTTTAAATGCGKTDAGCV